MDGCWVFLHLLLSFRGLESDVVRASCGSLKDSGRSRAIHISAHDRLLLSQRRQEQTRVAGFVALWADSFLGHGVVGGGEVVDSAICVTELQLLLHSLILFSKLLPFFLQFIPVELVEFVDFVCLFFRIIFIYERSIFCEMAVEGLAAAIAVAVLVFLVAHFLPLFNIFLELDHGIIF